MTPSPRSWTTVAAVRLDAARARPGSSGPSPAARDSGSSRSCSDVDPIRSAKTMVTVFRTSTAGAGLAASACPARRHRTRAPGRPSAPQAGIARASPAPQPSQNGLPIGSPSRNVRGHGTPRRGQCPGRGSLCNAYSGGKKIACCSLRYVSGPRGRPGPGFHMRNRNCTWMLWASRRTTADVDPRVERLTDEDRGREARVHDAHAMARASHRR
jgi:hypothetical protein